MDHGSRIMKRSKRKTKSVEHLQIIYCHTLYEEVQEEKTF